MSSKMADLRHLGEAHESERGRARQVREDFRFLQAAADGSVTPLELLRFSPDTWSPGCASLLIMRTVARSILEGLFVTYWALLGDENARTVVVSFQKEGARLLRNLLQRGRGVV
jgi:hypothetical protein